MSLTLTEIICAEYGSRALGINNEHSDSDYMAIVVENCSHVTGIREFTGSREGTGTGPNGRFLAEDTDKVIYPLRKWARLAAKGNPTVLQILFSEDFQTLTDEGSYLLSATDAFVSKKAGGAFLGYMQSQRAGVEGTRSKKTNRPELVHTHGFDSKFGSHYLRLGMQGIELMSTGRMTLPMEEADRDVLLAVRRGEMSKEEVLKLGDLLERNLKTAIDESQLPETADVDRIDAVLHEIYESVWKDSDSTVPFDLHSSYDR